MHLTRTQVIILGILGLVILIGALMFLGILPGLRSKTPEALSGKLTIWGPIDTPDIFRDSLFAAYQQLRPGVEISYRQMDEATYEEDIIDALAAGTGPDIFLVKNTWLPKHFEKLYPLTSSQLPIENIRTLYPSVIEQDLTANENVYGLPLSIDTLALYYNKQMFDNAGVAEPPRTWEQFVNLIPRLRSLDKTGKITLAAAAIGGSIKTIPTAGDLVSLLLLQDNVKMTDDSFTAATFSRDGEKPFRSYIGYANSANPNYTWNDNFSPALDAFSQEEVAMIFDYADKQKLLKAKSPFLNFAIAPMLQKADTKTAVNYAQYWALGVSTKSQNIALAWDFVLAASTNPTINESYLRTSGRSPALRSLINKNINDPIIGIFSRQALTTKSWRQIDASFISTTFSQMIESVITGKSPADRALKTAEEAISALMRRKNQTQ